MWFFNNTSNGAVIKLSATFYLPKYWPFHFGTTLNLSFCHFKGYSLSESWVTVAHLVPVHQIHHTSSALAFWEKCKGYHTTVPIILFSSGMKTIALGCACHSNCTVYPLLTFSYDRVIFSSLNIAYGKILFMAP